MILYHLLVCLALCAATAHGLRCYSRSTSNISYSGTAETCSGATTTCYAEYTALSLIHMAVYIGGCGTCDATQPGGCRMCSTDLCNSLGGPSSISCYSTIGPLAACAQGINTCFSMHNSTMALAGCGSCSSATANGCQVCGTSGCNSVLQSQIACFSYSTKVPPWSTRYAVNFPLAYSLLNCNSGLTTCYSVTSGSYTAGGCGVCTDEDSARGCKTCSTNFCNPFAGSAAGLGDPGWVAPAAAAAAAFLMLRSG